jgi:hypothetical protein
MVEAAGDLVLGRLPAALGYLPAVELALDVGQPMSFEITEHTPLAEVPALAE